MREPLWDRVLTLCHDRGQPYLWGFAADDTHSKQQDRIGLSFLVARMPAFTECALKHALRNGAFYTSNGPLVSDIQVTDHTITITLPAPCDVRWLKSGQYGVGPAAVGPTLGENHCCKLDCQTTTSTYALNDEDGTTDPRTGRFVRALVIDSAGRIAQTMPFRILGPKRIATPYPATGAWYRGMTHNHCDATGFKRTPVRDYHRAYHQRGHHWVFATDYGYWLTPFQRYPDGAVPTIRGITPDRGSKGEAVRITIFGSHFQPGAATVLVGGRPASDCTWLYENRLEVTVPADLPVGPHDVTFVPENGFNDTLPAAYTVQAPRADQAGWTTYTTRNAGLPGNKTLCVACNGDDVWVGTQFGAARYDGKRWEAVTRRDNRWIGDAILSIAIDRKGNTWFAHFRGITQRRPDGTWRLYNRDDGLPSREGNRVFVDSKDNVWVTYNGRSSQVSRFDGTAWQHFTPPNAVGQRMSLAIAEDDRGRILVAPRKSGVGIFDGKDWKVWTTENTGLADNFVRRIRRGPDGALYFATTALGFEPVGGLSVLRDGKWTTYTQSRDGLASYRVWDVCVDRKGNVWCATSRGVSRLSPDGRWTTFTTRNSGLAFDFVLGAAEAPDGAIWFATARGLSRFKP